MLERQVKKNWKIVINYFVTTLIFTCLTSCEWLGNSPSFGDDFITYDIRQGQHEPENNGQSIFTSSSLRFQTIFDSTCIYNTISPENQFDINKLAGFSDCSSAHHENSARFGWNWMENALHIYAYVYAGGKRSDQHLGTVELGKSNSYRIAIVGNTYVFTLNGIDTVMPRQCSGGVGVAYKLFPYFGGDEVAPHDMRIKIRYLD